MTHPEVSFVIPCLNEAETIVECVTEVFRWAADSGVSCEAVIADNGSTDGSQELAAAAGARVVDASPKGYGASVRAGIQAAQAPLIVMMDADLSYDPAAASPLLAAIHTGADLAIGSRLRGAIAPGAMPTLHRRLGTPTLTTLTRLLFGGQLTDTQSGMRAFRREKVLALGLCTTGMEFASEMIARALMAGLVIREVPIPFRRDGRSRTPHLRPWRDGWRHLRLLLLLAPHWTLTVPGLGMSVIGLVLLGLVAAAPLHVGAVTLDLHTMTVACMSLIVGYQAVTIGVVIRFNPLRKDQGPRFGLLRSLAKVISFESCLWVGIALCAAGVALIAGQSLAWAASGFGELPLESSLRVVLVGATLFSLGAQTILVSVVSGMLGLVARPRASR